MEMRKTVLQLDEYNVDQRFAADKLNSEDEYYLDMLETLS